ncbi:MAG: hotdog domain-containing protein [Sphingobium sp.]
MSCCGSRTGAGNGHVSNGKIATLADGAREAIHTHVAGDRAAGHAIQLVETSFRFFEEVTYPGALTIGVGIVRIGNSSLQQRVGFFREERCFVLSQVVSVKTAGGRSTSFTPEERARAMAYIIQE